MAYLVARPAQRYEIRESRQTAAGPRSRRLARFQNTLTREILEIAHRTAVTSFDRDALIERARELGIPVEIATREPEFRALLARLKRDDAPAGLWIELLKEALAGRPAAPVPEALVDVSEWIGADDHERGRTLRDLLDTYSRIEESRDLPRRRRGRAFPRFSSTEVRAAS